MSNDSNSLKKDLNINLNKRKFKFISISIIVLISILNLAILIFIVFNSEFLFNSFSGSINQKALTSDNNLSLDNKKDIDTIWKKIDELNNKFTDYRKLENKIISENHYNWIINESDYLINLIAIHIILNGNISSAIESLEILDNRLSFLQYPEIVNLRKSIRADLLNITQKNYVDITSASLDVDYISNVIDKLPSYIDNIIVNNKNDNILINNDIQDIKKNQNTHITWYRNILDDIKNSAINLVSVRKIKGDFLQLSSPDQIFFVKENMKLKLQDARIALLNRNEVIYKSDLNFVKNYIDKYFDINSKIVQDTDKKLDKLLSLDLKLPSINDLLGTTLNAIKNFKNDNYKIIKDVGDNDLKDTNKDINNTNIDENDKINNSISTKEYSNKNVKKTIFKKQF